MIPAAIATYLRDRYPGCVYRVHPTAETGAALAAAELSAVGGVACPRVAKVVVLSLGGELVMAVVSALARVDPRPLEELMGSAAALAGEAELAARFRPCEPGAAAPIALFGVPIFADDSLLRDPAILFPAGTHVDAVVIETGEWAWRERVLPVTHLGRGPVERRWRVGAPLTDWTPRPGPEPHTWRAPAAPDLAGRTAQARSVS